MIKKYAFIPLLTQIGGFILGVGGRAVSFVFANPIKTAVTAYLATETNLIGDVVSDIDSLSKSLFGARVSKNEVNKAFSRELSVEFQEEFNKFNLKMSKEYFKNVFHGYYTLILLGKESEANESVESILLSYNNEFEQFRNKFILKKLGENTNSGDKTKIIKAFNQKLNNYPSIFETDFRNVLKGLKEKALNEKLSEEDKKKLEGELGIDETKPTIEGPVARSVYTNVPSPFYQKIEEMEAWRRKRRQDRISRLKDYQNPSYESYDSYGDLKLAFYDFINSMPDKKNYDNYLKKEGISSDHVFNEIKRYIPTGSRGRSTTTLMNDISAAFCNYISNSYEYKEKFKNTCKINQYNKPYVIPPNSLGTKLEKEVEEESKSYEGFVL